MKVDQANWIKDINVQMRQALRWDQLSRPSWARLKTSRPNARIAIVFPIVGDRTGSLIPLFRAGAHKPGFMRSVAPG